MIERKSVIFAIILSIICGFSYQIISNHRTVLEQIENLKFNNQFTNNFEENIFYKRVTPRKLEGNPKILYINNNAASVIDLQFPENINENKDLEKICEYLTGSKFIPGSDPIAIPMTERSWVRNATRRSVHQVTKNLMEDGDGILLGSVENGKGEVWDLFLKGFGRTPYTHYENTGLVKISQGLREMVLTEALHYLDIPTRRTIAVIATEQELTLNSTIMLLQIARSHIRQGTVDFILENHSKENAEKLIDYVITKQIKSKEAINNEFCSSDDDDDEEDDDEYCHMRGAPELFKEVYYNFGGEFQKMREFYFTSGIVSSTFMALDGTILDLPYGQFVQRSAKEQKLVSCMRERGVKFVADWRERMRLLLLDFGARMDLKPYFLGNTSYELNKKMAGSYLQFEDFKTTGVFEPDADARERFNYMLSSFDLDYAIFRRNLADLMPYSLTEDPEETSADETLRAAIIRPITRGKKDFDKYVLQTRVLLQMQVMSPQNRKLWMDSYIPYFIPREWIIRNVIRDLVDGNDKTLLELMDSVSHPYDTEKILTSPKHPQEWIAFRQVSTIACEDGDWPIPIPTETNRKVVNLQ